MHCSRSMTKWSNIVRCKPSITSQLFIFFFQVKSYNFAHVYFASNTIEFQRKKKIWKRKIWKTIKKNKKGSYIHFKIKGNGNVIDELEKNEAIDKKLLRYLTVRVKKFDLDKNFFGKKEESEKKESAKN